MDNEILVSVEIVSYYAENTIIDTLESIKKQTYKNIELIVSDDCSKDRTIEVVSEWFLKNNSRFVRTKLLTVEKNTGVCDNLNRGLKECHGLWVKVIAADDILLPTCIEDFVEYVKKNPDSRLVTSLVRVYKNTFAEENYVHTMGDCSNIAEKSLEDQMRLVAFRHTIASPSCFYNKQMLEELGGWNDQYGYEDHPFFLTFLEHGFRIHYIPKETVGYRIHNSTVNSSDKLFNPEFICLSKKFRKERCFKYYSWKQKLSLRMSWLCYSLFDTLNLNRNRKFNRLMFRAMMSVIYRIG